MGLSICALRASAPRTSANVSGSSEKGWLTPATSDMNGVRELDGKRSGGLNTEAAMAGWATPTVHDTKGTDYNRYTENGKGENRSGALQDQAQLSGWPTPIVNDTTGSQYAYSQGNKNKPVLKLPGAAQMVGWPTPATTDHKGGYVGGAHEGRETLDGSAGRDGADRRSSPTNGQWRDADWLFCRDGKWRPVEPGTFPLAQGAPARVGRLRAYGNAIVPQVAAEVIGAYLET